jgi:hypothetical protein
VYHDVQLDMSGSPHFTGHTTSIHTTLHPVPAIVWPPDVESDSDGERDDGNQEEPGRKRTQKLPRIAGPISTAKPSLMNWKFADEKPSTVTRTFTKLLRIKSITTHLTRTKIIGNARPNCEKNWNTTRHHVRIPMTESDFKKVWKSLGTPLSDATEERIWRRVVHRAIDVRNRHPELTDHSCRLHGCHETESMIHLVQCRSIAPYWDKILQLAPLITRKPAPQLTSAEQERLLLFGLHKSRPASVVERAILRHAWQVMYRHFTRVETDNLPFLWKVAYLHTVTTIRDAALRLVSTRQRNLTRVAHGMRPTNAPDVTCVKGILYTETSLAGTVYVPYPPSVATTYADEIARATADAKPT